MSMRALTNIYVPNLSIPPAAVGAITKTGTAVDISNMTENVFVFAIGGYTDGTWTPSLTYSGTAGGAGTYTACAIGDVVGAPAALSAANTTAKIAYIGQYQYVKPVWTAAGTTTGAFTTCTAFSKPRKINSST